MARSKNTLTWSKLSADLKKQSQKELFKLIKDLHDLSQENRNFIVARFQQDTANTLKKYKATIRKSLYPDWNYKTEISFSAARKAISSFNKANGNTRDVLELMVYYMEVGTETINEFGIDFEQYYNSMESMFNKVVTRLKGKDEQYAGEFVPRLQKIVKASEGLGWGYGDAVTCMFNEAFSQKEELRE